MLVRPLSAALAAPRASASALASIARTLAGPPRQVDGEGAVVGEAVERPPAGTRQRAGQQPVGALVEKGAGLLALPGRGQVADRRLRGPRSRAAPSPRTSATASSSPSRRRTAASFRSRIPSGANSSASALDDGARASSRVRPRGSGPPASGRSGRRPARAARRPRHGPADSRWHRCRGAAARRRASRSRHQAASTGTVGPLEQAEADLRGGRVERLPDEAPAGVVHRHEPRRAPRPSPRSDRSRDGPAPSARRRAR